MKVVSVYNENGWQRDLPSLLLGRANHGCTSFFSGNKRVNRDPRWMGKCNLTLLLIEQGARSRPAQQPAQTLLSPLEPGRTHFTRS